MALEEYLSKGLTLMINFMPRLFVALITLVVGLWIIRIIIKMTARLMRRQKVDITLRPFLLKLMSISLKVMLVISVAGMMGLQVTSFIAVLGAAGLAVGMALQGSLSNFAGGVLILLFKPFKVGDYIKAQGHSGTVHEIQIFNTILKTPDNKTIIIPNGILSNGSMVNYSTESTRRLDFEFGISYEDDIRKAKKTIESVVKKEKRIFKEPPYQIVVGELGDSSVNLILRMWVKKEDYWDIKFDMIESVKYALDKAKIKIPYPQMDVHVKKR